MFRPFPSSTPAFIASPEVHSASLPVSRVRKYIYVHQCLVTWFAQVPHHLVTTYGDYRHYSRPYFCDLERLPGSIFRVLLLLVTLRVSLTSGQLPSSDNVWSLCCFSISCLFRCQVLFHFVDSVCRGCLVIYLHVILESVSLLSISSVTAFTDFVNSSSLFLQSFFACLFLMFCTAASAN